MSLGWCPKCEELVGISPNGVDPKKSNKRQRLDMHPVPDPENPGQKKLCDGSGVDI